MLVTVGFLVDRPGGGAHRVTPVVDGRNLVALVGAYETSHGFDVPGGYDGLIIENFRFGDLKVYLSGLSDGWPGDHRVALLGCTCGEVGCWPLMARVRSVDNHVRWDSFSQPHRPQRDYSAFGPFVFERSQYGSALDALVAEVIS